MRLYITCRFLKSGVQERKYQDVSTGTFWLHLGTRISLPKADESHAIKDSISSSNQGQEKYSESSMLNHCRLAGTHVSIWTYFWGKKWVTLGFRNGDYGISCICKNRYECINMNTNVYWNKDKKHGQCLYKHVYIYKHSIFIIYIICIYKTCVDYRHIYYESIHTIHVYTYMYIIYTCAYICILYMELWLLRDLFLSYSLVHHVGFMHFVFSEQNAFRATVKFRWWRDYGGDHQVSTKILGFPFTAFTNTLERKCPTKALWQSFFSWDSLILENCRYSTLRYFCGFIWLPW